LLTGHPPAGKINLFSESNRDEPVHALETVMMWNTRRIAALAFVLMSAGLQATATASDEARSRVLSLVSLEYQLDGKQTPRTHDAASYLPSLTSGNIAVIEVAALSVYWERYALEMIAKDRARMAAADNFFGGVGLVTGGASGKQGIDIDQQRKELDIKMQGPFQQAAKKGALAAYKKANVLDATAQGFQSGIRDLVPNGLQATADFYAAQAKLAKMQDVLWNRAEALAKGGASSRQLGGEDVEITIRLGKGKETIVVHNKSLRDLHHVTLAAVGPDRPTRTPNTPADQTLGGLAVLMGGEEDAQKILKGAVNQAAAVRDYEAVRSRPMRVFLHVANLPAGKEMETHFRFLASDVAKGYLGKFSLWTDEGSIEGQPIGGFDELRATIRKNRAKGPAGQKAAQSLLAAHHTEKWDLVLGGAAFHKIASQYPTTEEAAEARKWLEAYPRALIDRADPWAKGNPTYSARLYGEVIREAPKSEEAKIAHQRLEAMAEPLLEKAMELDRTGNHREAALFFTLIAKELPKSEQAAAARAALGKSTRKPARKR
jgi:hypothetical protein